MVLVLHLKKTEFSGISSSGLRITCFVIFVHGEMMEACYGPILTIVISTDCYPRARVQCSQCALVTVVIQRWPHNTAIISSKYATTTTAAAARKHKH